MEPILKFYGNHNLNFLNNSYEDLTRHITLELRRLAMPFFDDIILLYYDRVMSEDPPALRTRLFEISEWTPLSIPVLPVLQGMIRNVVLIGPMGLLIWFTPQHIEFASPVNNRIDWYSPKSRDKVMLLRRYFFLVINLFSGNTAIYITERQVNQYYSNKSNNPGEAFKNLTNNLIAKYGLNTKSMFNFPHGKYPKYYIDNFADIKNETVNV